MSKASESVRRWIDAGAYGERIEDTRDLLQERDILLSALAVFVKKYNSAPDGVLGIGLTNSDFFAARAAYMLAVKDDCKCSDGPNWRTVSYLICSTRRKGNREMNELKPCPFCGNKEPYFGRTGTGWHSCIVECGNCGCSHESGDEGEHSGSSWNARDESELSALREKCEELQRQLGEEQEAHAQLQTRCFDGGGSQSVFDRVAELQREREEAAKQEPVAWRVRWKTGSNRDREWEMWCYRNELPEANDAQEVQALYALPLNLPALLAAAKQEMRERCITAIEESQPPDTTPWACVAAIRKLKD